MSETARLYSSEDQEGTRRASRSRRSAGRRSAAGGMRAQVKGPMMPIQRALRTAAACGRAGSDARCGRRGVAAYWREAGGTERAAALVALPEPCHAVVSCAPCSSSGATFGGEMRRVLLRDAGRPIVASHACGLTPDRDTDHSSRERILSMAAFPSEPPRSRGAPVTNGGFPESNWRAAD